jgi:hypothetical protein
MSLENTLVELMVDGGWVMWGILALREREEPAFRAASE